MQLSLALLPLALLFQVADALLNVTVDDTDPSIVYQGNWEASSTHHSGLDYGGTHTVSSDTSASATFTFTGVACYYLSPKWPYFVNTQLSLDGGPGVIVNLTDPNASPTPPGGSESAQSSVVWFATGLANTSHTLLLTMASTGQFIVSDGFIFTVNNGSSASSPSSSASGSSAPSLSSPSIIPATAPQSNTLAIALGCSLGFAVLAAACIAIYVFFYRRRKRDNPSSHRFPLLFEADDGEPGHEDQDGAVTPFLAGATSPEMQSSSYGASVQDATINNNPSLVAPYNLHDPYEDDLGSSTASSTVYRDGARYTSVGEKRGGSSGYGPTYGSSSASGSSSSGAESSSSASTSLLGPAAATTAGRYVNEKRQPLRMETVSPAPPAYTE